MSPASRFLVEDALRTIWGAALVALVLSSLTSYSPKVARTALVTIVALGTVGLVLYQIADREGFAEPERS